MSLGSLIGSALGAFGLIIPMCVIAALCCNRLYSENELSKLRVVELEAYSVFRDTFWWARVS